jgi:hypothetical protein
MPGQEALGRARGWKRRLPNQLLGGLEEFSAETVVSNRAPATFGTKQKQRKAIDLAADSVT